MLRSDDMALLAAKNSKQLARNAFVNHRLPFASDAERLE